MVEVYGQNSSGIDFSIMPSLECNLRCSFCMYDCCPERKQQIDLKALESFLSTIPLELINSYGLYGGEPSINLPLYTSIIALLPATASIFIITNGSWSKPKDKEFVDFVMSFDLTCFISSTPEHKEHQDLEYLEAITKLFRKNFIIKGDDTQGRLLRMGRGAFIGLEELPYCTVKCVQGMCPKRLAVMPNGDVIFQSCDGVYPVVGNIESPFNLEEYSRQVQKCQFARL